MNTLKISQAHGNKICSSRIGRLFDYQILNSLGFELVSIYFCLAPLVKAKAKPSHRTRCEGDTVQSTIVREWIQGDMEDWAVNHLCHSNRASRSTFQSQRPSIWGSELLPQSSGMKAKEFFRVHWIDHKQLVKWTLDPWSFALAKFWVNYLNQLLFNSLWTKTSENKISPVVVSRWWGN